MPIQHNVDGQSRTVFTVCSGIVTRDEVLRGFKELRNNSTFKPDFCQLADVLQVSNLDLLFSDVYAIRAQDPFSNKSKRAVVAPAGEATFGVARMYQSVLDSDQFQVFTSMLDAIVRLGLEVSILQAVTKAESSKHTSKKWSAMDLPRDVPKSFHPLKRRKKSAS